MGPAGLDRADWPYESLCTEAGQGPAHLALKRWPPEGSEEPKEGWGEEVWERGLNFLMGGAGPPSLSPVPGRRVGDRESQSLSRREGKQVSEKHNSALTLRSWEAEQCVEQAVCRHRPGLPARWCWC